MLRTVSAACQKGKGLKRPDGQEKRFEFICEYSGRKEDRRAGSGCLGGGTRKSKKLGCKFKVSSLASMS